MDETGEFAIQANFVMSRSERNRNRRFARDGGRIYTELADPSKEEGDTSLILYNAMLQNWKMFVVSNGVQTDGILQVFDDDGDFESAMSRYKYEPDDSFTPRIAGICFLYGHPFFKFGIIRKSPWDETCDRFFFSYETIGNGFGRCITTYACNGNPLPAFKGEPFLIPLSGNIENVANSIWEMLNEQNRVALVVKFISLQHGGASLTKIINRF
jgi:hypothetical protein